MAYDIGTARGVIEMEYNGRGIGKAKTDLQSLEKSGQQTGAAIDKSSAASAASMGVVGAELSKVADKGALTQSVLRNVGLTAANLGLVAVAGIGLALKATADFEAQLSAIQAVSGATGSELDALRGKALQLGADTAFTATEAAQAMEELVKAGLTVDEVLNGAADASVALAAAGGVSIPEAATLAANAMNQFNLEASDLTGVVDSIAGAANASAVDVSQLGQSLQAVGAVANVAGLSFEDTATAIALLGNAGIVGSDAGTSLKTMLQNLQPTTKKQIDLFKELGLLTEDGSNAFFDAQGNVKSYAEIAGVLDKALQGQTNQQKLLNLETLFGTDAIRAAAITADQGAKGVRDLNAEMGKTTAAEVAAARMDNFKGSLDQLGGSIQTLAIENLSGLLTGLRSFVDFLTEGVNAAGDFANEVSREAGPGFDSLISAVESVATIIADIIDVFDGLIAVAAKLTFAAAVAAFNTLAGVIEAVFGALEGNEEIILAVAGAWLILTGRLQAAVVQAGYLAVLSFSNLLNGLLRVQTAAATTTTSFTTLSAAAASALAAMAVVGAIVLAITAWQDYKQAVEETEAALKAAQEAKEAGDFAAMRKEVENLRKLAEDRRDAIDDFDIKKDFLTGITLGGTTDAEIDRINEMSDAASELEGDLMAMGSGLTLVAQKFGLIDTDKATELQEALALDQPEGLEGMAALLERMQPLLDQAGISAGQFTDALQGEGDLSLGDVITQLEAVTGKGAAAANATQTLTDAAKGFADQAKTAADAAQGLSEALDNLIGVELSADEAAIKWREGLRKLQDQLAKTGGTLQAGTVAGDENRQAVISQTRSLLDRIQAEAEAGTSLGKLTQLMREGRTAMIQAAGPTKAQRDNMRNLLNQYQLTPKNIRTIVEAAGIKTADDRIKALTKRYNLTPKKVKTIFEAAGADTAQEKVKALKDHIKTLKGKKAPIETPGAKDHAEEVKDLRDEIERLKGKDAPIATPGATKSEQEVRNLRNEIALLQGKSVTISVVRETINRTRNETIGSPRVPSSSPSDRYAPTPSPGASPGPTSTPRSSPSAPLRIVSGELALDPSGRAFISGVAADTDDDDDDYDDTLGRMN